MKCDLIFYLARKTGYCEKALQKQLSELSLGLNEITASTTPQALGEKLNKALKRTNLVFIIGGLGFSGRNGLTEVLSQALSSTKVTIGDVRKLKNEIGKQYGYVIRCGKQMIVALPDRPDELSEMFSPALISLIKEIAGVSSQADKTYAGN
ncbi:MAG: molybdopterin-binding protein [Ruminococcus sp.]